MSRERSEDAPLSAAEIGHLCRLARLDVTTEERAALRCDIGRILAYMACLDEAETENARDQSPPPPSRLREDEPRAGISREDALRNAPAHDGRHFCVPAVVRRPLKRGEGT